MRPSALVAGAALTAVLAVVALPEVVGSAQPTRELPVVAAAFQVVEPTATVDGVGIRLLDAAHDSGNALTGDGTFTEPGVGTGTPPGRVRVTTPIPGAQSAPKPPRFSLSGYATWYANGTTAMRLPYGTTIRVCGAGGCVERHVTDFGPSAAYPTRIVDMTPGDFATVCGCSTWRGTTPVRVDVY